MLSDIRPCIVFIMHTICYSSCLWRWFFTTLVVCLGSLSCCRMSLGPIRFAHIRAVYEACAHLVEPRCENSHMHTFHTGKTLLYSIWARALTHQIWLLLRWPQPAVMMTHSLKVAVVAREVELLITGITVRSSAPCVPVCKCARKRSMCTRVGRSHWLFEYGGRPVFRLWSEPFSSVTVYLGR